MHAHNRMLHRGPGPRRNCAPFLRRNGGSSSTNECGPGVQQPCTKVDPRRFCLPRMHFHAPSEHTLPPTSAPTGAQVQFPLEAQFVHVSRDKPERTAVLAVMFRVGKE